MDTQVDLALFLTLGGGAAIISALVEVIKRAANWTDTMTQRFAPLTAIVVGVIAFITISVATIAGIDAQGIAQGGLAGVVAGLTASGLYNIGGKQVIESVAGPA